MGYKLCCIDPPAITAIEVTEVCTNDFTVSWSAANNEEGLSYTVTLLPLNISVNSVMDTSYNFTGLMPDTDYKVNTSSIVNDCSGIATTIMVTTLTAEAGVPQSELLIVVNMYVQCMCTFEIYAFY